MNSLAPPDSQLNQDEGSVNFEPESDALPELSGHMNSRGVNSLATLADPQLNEEESPTNFETADEVPPELEDEIPSGINSFAPRANPQLNEGQGSTNFEEASEVPPELEAELTHGGVNAMATRADPQLNEQESPANFQEGATPPGTITGDKNYVHTQLVPSTLWAFVHNLGKFPTIAVIDSGGTVVYGTIRHLSINSTELEFSVPFSGTATCN